MSVLADRSTPRRAQNALSFESSLVRIFRAQGGPPVLFDVEVARSTEQKARGLMYRDVVPRGSGMLFILGPPERASFWMKNTRIPLDLVFARTDGVIESIIAMAKPYDLTPLSSQGLVSTVLEIAGGEALRLGIKPGDSLQYVVE